MIKLVAKLFLFFVFTFFLSFDGLAQNKNSISSYKTYKIDSFRCFVSDEVMRQEANGTWNTKPLAILSKALKKVNEVYPDKALDLFHRTFLFVDWNKPGALGLYVKGDKGPSDFSKHINCIELNGMKFVTESHNNKKLEPNNAATLVLIHELAHCYHHQILGWENGSIKNAYQNAKNKTIFDLKSYLMSSDKEYFAELTTAYLDKHYSTPKSKQEIKQKDVIGFALMESIWGNNDDKKGIGKQNKILVP